MFIEKGVIALTIHILLKGLYLYLNFVLFNVNQLNMFIH